MAALSPDAATTSASRGAAHLAVAECRARVVEDLPTGALARPVRAAGIIGAGTMGRGIALCFANAGLPVVILDTSHDVLARGLGIIERHYDSQIRRCRISVDEKAQRLTLIRSSLDYADLGTADVIIETACEHMQIKRNIFRAIDQVARAGAVLATNTSTLDIGAIARATSRPRDVIGMHFFSPAQVMPLLEVIRTEMTSASTIQTVMELSRPLKKTPVVSRVCYGFIGNRMMEGYAREAERMVLEGATPQRIDSVLEHFGMAMGVLAAFDMAGIDVSVSMHRANAAHYPPDPTYYQADFALMEAGRLGQKSGKGYYRYEASDRTPHEDPEAIELLRKRARQLGVERQTHTDAEIVERCLYPLLNEGFRILEEGIAQRASDIDVVWSAGYGFPRHRGGPMFYAETIGLATLRKGILRYRDRFGPMHWEPAPLLVKLVQQGKTIAQWERERGA